MDLLMESVLGIVEMDPRQILAQNAKDWNLKEDTKGFAQRMDKEDELRNFRELFCYPKKKNLPRIDLSQLKDENEEAIYFCGQSLGLPLKNMNLYLEEVVKNWGDIGVHSHFHGFIPAAHCDLLLKDKMAQLVGAQPEEIAIMNALTVNIHVMFSSFYAPTTERYKILMMDQCFHSDRFAVESQVKLRGLKPEETMIYLKPREGEDTLNLKDILSTIEREGHQIAVIFLEGVNYFSGQLIDMQRITRLGHKYGCTVGFDLAHAAGNVELHLHDWDVDFAVWCTYKYMNSGAGSLSSVFIHNKFTENGVNGTFPMLRGWWGLSNKQKFAMDREFYPALGADSFKLSNPSPFLAVMILANLEVFNEAGIESLVKKQRQLTGYLEYLIRKTFPETDTNGPNISIITPTNVHQRGCQLSLKSSVALTNIEEEFKKRGIVCDSRQSRVLRVAPVPLYNTFQEVFEFVGILKEIFDAATSGKASDLKGVKQEH